MTFFGSCWDKIVYLPLILGIAAWGQPQDARPKFEDFAVKKVYTGAPAAPKLEDRWPNYRTVVRKGAKLPVQFAGHYTVPTWGCGAGCIMFVVADSITGKLYDGFLFAALPPAWTEKHGEPLRIEFHPRSRLLKLNGCMDDQVCGFYDYVMIEGKGLRLVHKELLPAEFQRGLN